MAAKFGKAATGKSKVMKSSAPAFVKAGGKAAIVRPTASKGKAR